jgi:PII-like signaling protein
VSDAGLKLTAYLGERDRADGRFAADVVLDLFERAGVRSAILMRGAEGFGLKHHLATTRLLTLSEDLPIVATAVGEREQIEALLARVTSEARPGLTTLERVAFGPERLDEIEEAKLSVWLGRGERVGGRPAHRVLIDALRSEGLAAAGALLGVDGIAGGRRRRARFFAANADVPLIVEALGEADRVRSALGRLPAVLDREPEVTIERAPILKRNGGRLLDSAAVSDSGPAGLELRQKLTVHAGEQDLHSGTAVHPQLVRALRREGAVGATSLRGVWGYQAGGTPEGDSLWSIRRRVPGATTVIDTPERCRGWLRLIDELTDEAGLVTSELVPSSVAGPVAEG